MADDRPLPAHAQDDAAASADVHKADVAGASEAISPQDTALLEAQLAARRSLAEGLRDVLALPALGPQTKAVPFATLQDPEHLLKLWKRWHRRTPSLADALSIAVIAKALECGRQSVSAFREIADRLDGPVTQRVALTITPEQAERMSDEELAMALKRAGVPISGAPN